MSYSPKSDASASVVLSLALGIVGMVALASPNAMAAHYHRQWNRKVTISGAPPTSVQAGHTYSFQPLASDPAGAPISYSVKGKPSWASFSIASGRLYGTPASTDTGTYANITISASDGRSRAYLAPFSIEVNPATTNTPSGPPTISGSAPTSVTAGQNYTFTPSTTDPSGGALTFSISNRPAWATFNSSTGKLSGTATSGDVGIYSNIGISVSDGTQSASLAPFSISVSAAVGSSPSGPPTISGSAPTSVTAGQNYTFTPSATDPSGGTLTFSISNKPAWATFSSSTGTLSGTATTGDVGVYSNVGISVSDGNQSASLAPFSITVQQLSTQSIAGAPVVLYTDVISGPTSGGEGNNGMYLSLFGKNFGSTLSNIQVTIGGQPVAHVYYLGASQGRPDVQQISVQVGSLGGAAQGKPLPIVVTVNGTASNSNLTFTPNPGQICYVSNSSGVTLEGTAYPAGNDSTGACGDISHPFATIQTTDEYTGGVWPQVGPGDTIVVLPSSKPYQESGFESYFMRFYRGPGSNGGGSNPTGASGTGYTTLMGYPGAPPFINSPSSVNSSGAIAGSDSTASAPYVTVADLQVEGGGGDGAIDPETFGNDWRIVNNSLTAKTALASARSGCIAGDGYSMEILGNSCHDVDSPDTGMENHGIYIDAAGKDELAYNFLYDINDGNGIQLYDSAGTTQTIDNVVIHHNWIFNVAKHGINIADGSNGGIIVYDNVVANIAFDGIRFNTTSLNGCEVYNNTFYNTDLTGTGGYGSVGNDWNLSAGSVTFLNNIFVAYGGSSYISGSVGLDATTSTFSNNLYFGGPSNAASDIATIDPLGVFTDPQFVSAPTAPAAPPGVSNQISITSSAAFNLNYFTLQSTSPALKVGSSTVSSLVQSDFALDPAAAPYFIGAMN